MASDGVLLNTSRRMIAVGGRRNTLEDATPGPADAQAPQQCLTTPVLLIL